MAGVSTCDLRYKAQDSFDFLIDALANAVRRNHSITLQKIALVLVVLFWVDTRDRSRQSNPRQSRSSDEIIIDRRLSARMRGARALSTSSMKKLISALLLSALVFRRASSEKAETGCRNRG